MDTKHKERYEAPSTQMFEVKIEGICLSNPTSSGASFDEYEYEDFSW